MRTRARLPFTLSESTKISFEKFCVERQINRSRLIEALIIQYLKQVENKKQ